MRSARRSRSVTGESRAAVALMHQAERWRDRLLEDDAALTEFVAAHPAADVQWLRAAIRAARREIAAGQAPRHARELYRWLHEQLDIAGRPMKAERRHPDELILGLVSISDRASQGVYADQGLPALKAWFERALASPWQAHERLIPDERAAIEQALIELVDEVGCDLVLTTGGTGPARRDVTPEATLAVATREMPGFGEQMRRISLEFVPTAILSRQVGVVRETGGQPR